MYFLIILWLLDFLSQMIDNVKQCHTEISLSRTIRTIDNTILDNPILDSVCVE